jgi:membrane peptidoglycan carboxypeptidase
MTSTSEIVRLRRQRHDRPGAQAGRWLGVGCSLLLALFVALSGLGLAALYTSLTAGLPAVEMLPALLDPENGTLLQPTRIYDQSGVHVLSTLENPEAGKRQFLSLDDSAANYLPSPLISTTLAVTDPQFWSHPGALASGLNNDKAPTLAQRLVSDLLLWQEAPGLRRVLRERLLAMQITQRYGRPQVLAWYLNSADYGNLAYGAEAAARLYFGKPASELSLAEAAVLAATAEAPALNPLDAPAVARLRGKQVLNNMRAQDWISEAQWRQAGQSEVTFESKKATAAELAPAFTRLALEQAAEKFDLARLQRGGFQVITSLDYDLQTQAACAAAAQIARLENRPEPAETADGKPCQASQLLPTLPPEADPSGAKLDASIVILDPKTGRISAMVGDKAQAEHPAGTLLTPFVYLAGFTRGLSPASLLWDIPKPEASAETPEASYHGPVRLRTALANDYLAPAVQVIQQVGLLNVQRIASEMGILKDKLGAGSSPDDFLKDSQTTLLDTSQAYGAFANQGILVGRTGDSQPLAFLQLEDLKGKVLTQADPAASRPVISSQLAYLITHILSDEPARWPSLGHPNPLEIGRPAAVKPGKTQNSRDAWTVGYTPDKVVGVWVGNQDETTPSPVNPNAAAALWHAVIQQANRSSPPQGWNVPQGISNVSVCDPSGMLPTADCPTVVNEIFLSGSEPSQMDSLYRRVQVNRETGRLATVFTPPELVEERVYMEVPPEAQAWARQSGLTLPPESYDVILAAEADPDVHISTPETFSYVRGVLPITGSATGEGFKFYRLQVGRGLNPQEWEQVGEDQSQPVAEGELGNWDTSQLEGLYAIQLLVVRDDQRVETAITQVTVDNQPPEVEILSPAAGQAFDESLRLVTLRVNASDDLALKNVDFYIDGRRIASLTQSPFTFPWDATPGKHKLTVKAEDRAGNTSEASLEFSIGK